MLQARTRNWSWIKIDPGYSGVEFTPISGVFASVLADRRFETGFVLRNALTVV
jgi:hypothetical protein